MPRSDREARQLGTATSKGAKVGGPGSKEDQRLQAVANWLRNEKRSGLVAKEAIQYEKRVDYFKGSKLVDAFVGTEGRPSKYTGKMAKDIPVKSRAEAAKIGQELLRLGYFHRSQRVAHANSRRWELELINGPFDEDSLYTWIYEGSKTKLYLMCGGMLLGALVLCMIQIWPLWMKIGVWWCSVTFLTTFGVLSVVRLVLFCLMFIFGFRGIWLFPNLFDDNQTFAGSFQPIMGRADPVYVEEDSDEEYRAHMAKKKKKKEDDAAAKGEAVTPEKKKSQPKDGPPEKSFQFGWLNVVLIFGLGALACLKMGFFEGDNVPDFVAKTDDLQYYFKSLAPPEEANTTGDDGDTTGTGKGKGKEKDPWAAPQEEKKTRF
jgi:translocation protein SEC62